MPRLTDACVVDDDVGHAVLSGHLICEPLHGFGVRDPAASGTQRGAGTVTGGLIPALAYVSQSQTWGPVPAAPASAKPTTVSGETR